MVEELFTELVGTNPIVHGFVGGVVIATFNMVGAMLILLWRNPTERALDTALGFAAGIMLAASFTSLILPGIEIGGIVPVLVGFFFGVLLLDRADQWVPQVQLVITGRKRIENEIPDARVASVILFIVAITLHNMPEGLAVGVAFGSEDLSIALSLMIAIGLQNVPEGLAVSVAARNAGCGTLFYAVIVGIRAGLVEIPMAVFGAAAV